MSNDKWCDGCRSYADDAPNAECLRMLRCDSGCVFADGSPEETRAAFLPLLTAERAALDELERHLREDAARFSREARYARLNAAKVWCEACGFGVFPSSTPDSVCATRPGCVLRRGEP